MQASLFPQEMRLPLQEQRLFPRIHALKIILPRIFHFNQNGLFFASIWKLHYLALTEKFS